MFLQNFSEWKMASERIKQFSTDNSGLVSCCIYLKTINSRFEALSGIRLPDQLKGPLLVLFSAKRFCSTNRKKFSKGILQ